MKKIVLVQVNQIYIPIISGTKEDKKYESCFLLYNIYNRDANNIDISSFNFKLYNSSIFY